MGLAALEAGELGVGLEPLLPAGGEGNALALSGEDAVEVAAMHGQITGGDGRTGKADELALGLVRGGGHGLDLVVTDEVRGVELGDDVLLDHALLADEGDGGGVADCHAIAHADALSVGEDDEVCFHLVRFSVGYFGLSPLQLRATMHGCELMFVNHATKKTHNCKFPESLS